jgi:hypothetical protein
MSGQKVCQTFETMRASSRRGPPLEQSLRRRPPAPLHPRKTAVAPLPARDSEVIELRDRLLSGGDVDSCSLAQLIELQSHLLLHVQSCMANSQFVRAMESKRLSESVEREIARQSREASELQSELRVAAVSNRSAKIARYVLFLRDRLCQPSIFESLTPVRTPASEHLTKKPIKRNSRLSSAKPRYITNLRSFGTGGWQSSITVLRVI